MVYIGLEEHNLNHAREHLRELVKLGDVIPFENDFGDIYY